ncbi:hypothetical protein BV898_07003 [Hypsibius exemplaris]|uniref:Fe2OG dioxygenase domain-containing protein n=1 Tax=Hypsibius exemplaris TaxID=2072580 RepID=A0A1W0WUR9_HYPEX|nr:hypothetical protein BV898_07003 [Hypsibius exemplaris]
MTTAHIPVVDFGSQFQDNKEQLGITLVDIFRTVGFVYLKNHGVPEETIQGAFGSSQKFFELGTDTKKKYGRPPGTDVNSGYVPVGMERLNAFLENEHKTVEIREAYNYLPFDKTKLPSEVPQFDETLSTLFVESTRLARDIFECIALGLCLEKQDIFVSSHQLIGQRGNPTTLRTLSYPPIDPSAEDAAQLTRCGTHSDYGTITLLYQDEIGGLEVENRDDVFLPALPMPGTILVNVGDLLQRWTSDLLRSTRHRVTCNNMQAIKKTRQSLAFFVHPDDNFTVKCLDGSDKYPPVSAGEYLQDRFKLTY